MNWCQSHWDQLRAAIKDRGLDKFGAQNAQQATKELADQIEGKETAFDPLMGSWLRLNETMLDSMKKQGTLDFERAMQCPMCILVEDGQPHLVENWINGVTDDALRYATTEGLIKAH